MKSWFNALLVPWTGDEGIPESEVPNTVQVAVVHVCLGFVLTKLLKG